MTDKPIEIPNETDSDIITEGRAEEKPEKPTGKKRVVKKNRKKVREQTVRIFFFVILAFFLAIGFFMFDYVRKLNDPTLYKEFSAVGDVASNADIEFCVTGIKLVTEIAHYELDEKYYYFVIDYSIKNISEDAISWQKFPYARVGLYTEYKNEKTGKLKGYIIPEETQECEFDFNALRYYALEEGLSFFDMTKDLAKGETRTDTDIVKILKTDYEKNTYCVYTDIFSKPVALDIEIIQNDSGNNGGVEQPNAQ